MDPLANLLNSMIDALNDLDKRIKKLEEEGRDSPAFSIPKFGGKYDNLKMSVSQVSQQLRDIERKASGSGSGSGGGRFGGGSPFGR